VHSIPEGSAKSIDVFGEFGTIIAISPDDEPGRVRWGRSGELAVEYAENY